MIPVDLALAQVLALARPMPVEEVPLALASGRWLARSVTARRDQPPFDASAMDGYAIQGPAAAGAQFRVVGEAGPAMGSQAGLPRARRYASSPAPRCQKAPTM